MSTHCLVEASQSRGDRKPRVTAARLSAGLYKAMQRDRRTLEAYSHGAIVHVRSPIIARHMGKSMQPIDVQAARRREVPDVQTLRRESLNVGKCNNINMLWVLPRTF